MLHPARGVWVEIQFARVIHGFFSLHPARGVWVEIISSKLELIILDVAPRKGCVSRNDEVVYFDIGVELHPARGVWVEIGLMKMPSDILYVAPRKGCVSRNLKH